MKHLGAVYDLSRQFGFQFTTSVAQNSDFYFSTAENQTVDPFDLSAELTYVMRKELLSLSPKRWLRAYFYAGVLAYNVSKERILPCRAGRDSFFMDPAGFVYPCLTLNKAMGDIGAHAFEEIWGGTAADKVRSDVDLCRQPCWMICTARTAMMRRPHEPAMWILSNWIRIAARKKVG